MITALRMQLHHLRENGYYPRAIMVNQEGLDALYDDYANCLLENDLRPIDPDAHRKDMACCGLPVHFVPKLGSTFLIGV